jgi:hypothetical protein
VENIDAEEAKAKGRTYDLVAPHLKRPSAAEEVSKLPEIDIRFKDMKMVEFKPFEGIARFEIVPDDIERVRTALANALGVKLWDVFTKKRKRGGYNFLLPQSYVPSKHDEKLQEAAELIGHVGWYCTTDVKKRRGKIIPAELPTFPATFPLELRTDDPTKTMLGYQLPKHGDEPYEPMMLDWKSGSFALLTGLPGGGKSVTINALIAGQLAQGADIAIIDDESKSIDFTWCKPYVHENWWGCNSKSDALTVLHLVQEEGDKRAKILKKYNVENWLKLSQKFPESAFKPIFVVLDEAQILLQPPKELKALKNVNPAKYLQNEKERGEADSLFFEVSNTVSKYRFVGIRMVISTQVASKNTGIGTALRNKISFNLLQGSDPTLSQIRLAFSDPDSVPKIAKNITDDSDASKGVGTFKMEGGGSGIYKSMYADIKELKKMLQNYNLLENQRAEPTDEQREKYGNVEQNANEGTNGKI